MIRWKRKAKVEMTRSQLLVAASNYVEALRMDPVGLDIFAMVEGKDHQGRPVRTKITLEVEPWPTTH